MASITQYYSDKFGGNNKPSNNVTPTPTGNSQTSITTYASQIKTTPAVTPISKPTTPTVKPLSPTPKSIFDSNPINATSAGLSLSGPLAVHPNQPKLTFEQINSITKPISGVDKTITTIQNYFSDPKAPPVVKAVHDFTQNYIEPFYESNPVLRGVQKGIVSTFLGSSRKAADYFNKPIDKPVDNFSKGAYTTGQIIGTTVSYLGTGEVLQGLNLGRAALPILFATLGQTSSGPDLTVKQRLEKVPVDLFAGWLFSKVPGSEKLVSPEALKQLGLSSSIVGGQSFLDSLIEGLSPKEAAKVSAKMMVIAGLFHIGATATGLIGKSVIDSKFNSGVVEMTPEQARNAVINTSLENHPVGKEIIKSSIEAEAQGKNLKIDMGVAKKSAVSKTLNLDTPEGIKLNSPIELVDPKATLPTDTNPENPVDTNASITTYKGAIDKNTPVPEVQKAAADALIRKPETFRSDTEKQAYDQLKSDPIAMRDEYIQKFGNEVSTDNAIELFKGYNKSNYKEFQNPAYDLKNIVLDHLFESRKGVGNNTILITGGGPGSGKSTALGGTVPYKQNYPIVLDSTLGSISSIKDIANMLEKGYKIHIAYVIRDPVVAWKQGVLNRDRAVPENYHIKVHEKAQKNILELYDKYKNNPNVQIDFIDNTGPAGTAKPVSVDVVRKMQYNKDEIKKQIYESTDKKYNSGSLTEEKYKAFTGDRNSAANSGQSEQKSTEKVSASSDTSYQGKGNGLRKTVDYGINASNVNSEEIAKVSDENVRKILSDIKGNPNAEVTIYRATKGDTINKGDFVTLSKTEAEKYSKTKISKTPIPGVSVKTMVVRAEDLDYQKGLPEAQFAYNPKSATDKPKYDYQSTQLDLPTAEAKKIKDFAQTIPNDKLSIDKAEGVDGIEKDPHVTVVYGLNNNINVDQVKSAVGKFKPVELKLGKTSIFENPKYDVLKVDVSGDSLMELNKKIDSTLDVPGKKFNEYKPHITIAYLKKGEGAAYADNTTFEGDTITLDKLTFSTNSGEKIIVPLTDANNDRIITENLTQPPKSAEEVQSIIKKANDLIEEGHKKLQEQNTKNEYISSKLDLYSSQDLANIDSIKKIANSKSGQEGDIETLRKINPKLVDSVVEAVRVANKDYQNGSNLSDEKALNIALELPTRSDIKKSIPAEIKEAKQLLKDSGITITNEFANSKEINLADFEKQFNEANKQLPIPEGQAVFTKDSAERLYNNIKYIKSVDSTFFAAEPVGTGKLRESEAYRKVRDRLEEATREDVNYNRLNLAQDAENAMNFIAKNPDAALRVAFGMEAPPTGQTETAISIALADKAGREGKFKLQSQLEASRSLRQTRRGQEIVSERGRFNDDSPHRYIAELLDQRLTNLGRSLKDEVMSTIPTEHKKYVSPKKRAVEKIDNEVKKLKDILKKRDRNKIKMAQDVINSLICK